MQGETTGRREWTIAGGCRPWALALLLAFAGCPAGDDDDDSAPGDDDTADDDTGEPADGRVGQVRLFHWQVDSEFGDVRSVVSMWGIYDAPFPGEALGVVSMEAWEVVAEAGDCVYIDRIDPGLCEPPCPGGEICDHGGECVPLPSLQPAGTLTVDGLRESVVLEPDDLGYYHLEGSPGFPLFDADATVTLTAAGGATAGFQVEVGAVEDLASAVPCELQLAAGQPLEVSWEPGNGAATVRWEMFTFMHAGNGPMLRCVTGDDGQLTVAAELVDLYLADRTGFETYELARFRAGAAGVGDGRSVALEVASIRTCFHLPQ